VAFSCRKYPLGVGLLGFGDSTLGDVVGRFLLCFDLVKTMFGRGGVADRRGGNVMGLFEVLLQFGNALLEAVDDCDQQLKNTRNRG